MLALAGLEPADGLMAWLVVPIHTHGVWLGR